MNIHRSIQQIGTKPILLKSGIPFEVTFSKNQNNVTIWFNRQDNCKFYDFFLLDGHYYFNKLFENSKKSGYPTWFLNKTQENY